MSREVIVITDAEARVKEEWKLEVPDDFPVGQYEDEPELWLDVLEHLDQFGATIINVKDEVYGETDREVTLWEVTG